MVAPGNAYLTIALEYTRPLGEMDEFLILNTDRVVFLGEG